MDIHEYQAKKLLADFGVVIPRGGIETSEQIATDLKRRLDTYFS